MCLDLNMIISVDEYRAMTGSKASDEQLNAIIKAVEQDYLRIRNHPFNKDGDGNIIYPVGAKLTASAMVTYMLTILPGSVGLSSETIGDYSASFAGSDMLHGYPRHIVTAIRRYGRDRPKSRS